MAKRDLMGIGNIEEQINQAPEVQSATGLLDEVKKCAPQLVAILNGVNYLNTKTEMLESSYKEQIKKMQEASTFVIPPQTVKLLNEVFAAFVTAFKNDLNSEVDKKVEDIEDKFSILKSRLEEHERQMKKHANRIALPFPFFYGLIWSLVCMCCFFTLVAFAAFVKYDIPVVENAIWLFGILMLVGDGVIVYLAVRAQR